MNDKNFKKQEITKLSNLLDKGYLKETEVEYGVMKRKGKLFTRVKMAFVVDIKGVVFPEGTE